MSKIIPNAHQRPTSPPPPRTEIFLTAHFVDFRENFGTLCALQIWLHQITSLPPPNWISELLMENVEAFCVDFRFGYTNYPQPPTPTPNIHQNLDLLIQRTLRRLSLCTRKLPCRSERDGICPQNIPFYRTHY